MNGYWLHTDEKEDLLTSLTMLNLTLIEVRKDVSAWKWAIIVTHSALQSAFVCYLSSIGNSLLVAKPEDADAWLKAHYSDKTYPEMMLDSFLNLYHKIKQKKIDGYKFVPHGTQGKNIKRLNKYRNEFIHFFPKDWSIEVSGLPEICKDCLDVISQLYTNTLQRHFQKDQQSSLILLLDSCYQILNQIKLN
jgi:hypothetical protein